MTDTIISGSDAALVAVLREIARAIEGPDPRSILIAGVPSPLAAAIDGFERAVTMPMPSGPPNRLVIEGDQP
jgi:hypothetical protein